MKHTKSYNQRDSRAERKRTKDGSHMFKGVPFVLTDENRDSWNMPGKSRGWIVSGSGQVALDNQRMVDPRSFSALSMLIRARGESEAAREYLARPEVQRMIRNRPALKRLLGGSI